jgi:excisionase family DNA binding protein
MGEIMSEQFLSEYPDILTTKHLEKILGLKANTITQKARSGEIPARKFGRDYRFAKPLIIKLLLSTDDAGLPEELSDADAAKIAKLR